MAEGMLFDLLRLEPRNCKHRSRYKTQAYVPAGICCADCGALLNQDYVPPNEPEIIGYVSAQWEWHYVEGRPWTTSASGPG